MQCGQTIRFMHLATRRNLHCHHFSSPLSNNLEVSAFGENGDGDEGDYGFLVLCGSISVFRFLLGGGGQDFAPVLRSCLQAMVFTLHFLTVVVGVKFPESATCLWSSMACFL